jgi:diguanylate cyclase (GGDEF)-like protein
MDFKKLLEGHKNKTCIMSVERFQDDSYGNIRIVEGNKAHYDDMLNMMHHPFVPDSPYEHYFPQNKNFEDFCYRASFLGQPLHSYVELPQMGLWLNMFLLPLDSDKENIGYCMYTYDVTPFADSEQQASLSADTSSIVLKTCIKLRGSGDLRKTFNEVVEDIRQICDSDHCCILLTDTVKRRCTTLCEAIRPGCGLLPMDTYLDEGFFDISQTWNYTLGDSTCVIIKDEHDREWLKSINPIWYDSLKGAGAETIVLFPLNYNGETLGYMWSINFNVENTVKIKETLELTTFFIASEISNYRLLQKLELLSTLDMLTGVMNRNTMNNDVDLVADGKGDIKAPYAVIFADLNGLKRVNDERGHGAGDKVLKLAAEILCEIFPGGKIYRAGGDEFVVLAKGVDEAALERKVKMLHEHAEATDDVRFAVGTCMVKGDEDIRAAMRIADERMYDDKKDYYIHHPERVYR